MAWATKLVGRGAELGELRRELRRARAAEFRIVLFVAFGPGASGRHASLASFSPGAGPGSSASPRARIRWGETTSFGVWSEALESHLRGLPPNEIPELCGGFVDDLAALLHSVAAVHGSADREPSRLRRWRASLSCSRPRTAYARRCFWMTAHLADVRRGGLGDFASTIGAARVLVLVSGEAGELAKTRPRCRCCSSWSRTERCDWSCHLGIRSRPRSSPERPSLIFLRRRRRTACGAIRGNSSSPCSRSKRFLTRALIVGTGCCAPSPKRSRARGRQGPEAGRTCDRNAPVAAAIGPVSLPRLVGLIGRPVDRLVCSSSGLSVALVSEQGHGHELTYESRIDDQEAIYERVGAARRRG